MLTEFRIRSLLYVFRVIFYMSCYLKGFAPMPPAPFMPSAVVWRRSGFEAKWSGKLSGKIQYRPNMSSKWCPHGPLEASWEPPGGFLGASWRAPAGQAARLEGQC